MNNLDPKSVPEQWEKHVSGCVKCQRFDRERTATLALTCVEGAVLLKDLLELEAQPILARQRRAENEVWRTAMHITPEMGPTTKKKARQAMRYKGECS